jgi:hypothetical protein
MKDQLSRKIKLNRLSAYVCLIIGVIYYILIYYQASPREIPGARGFGRLTGRFFPELGGGVFLLSSAFLLLKSFLNEKLIKKTEDLETLKGMLDRNEAVVGVSRPEFIFSALIMVLGLVYVSAIPFLGYLVATIVSVFVLSRVMGNTNWLYLFILSVMIPSIIYYVFISLLYVPLPRGFLDF